MKRAFFALMLLAFPLSAFAEVRGCPLTHMQATFLSETLKTEHIYFCSPAGPVIGAEFKSNLTTCIYSGISREEFGSVPAVSVVSKYGMASMADGLKVGNVYGFHANGFQKETVSITEKTLDVKSPRRSKSGFQISLDLENGSGVISAEYQALNQAGNELVNKKFSVPMECQQLQ